MAQQTESFVCIHEHVRNDNACGKEKQYNFKIFQTKREAVEYLIEQYALYCFSHCENDDPISEPGMKQKVIDHIIENDCVIFEWEWERRENFDMFWVVPLINNEFSFYAAQDNTTIEDIIDEIKENENP